MLLSTAIPIVIAAIVIVIISKGISSKPIIPKIKNAAIKLGTTPINDNVKFLNNINPDSLWIKSDQTRLKQILLNLLSNAIKFTNKGSVTITIDNFKSEGDHLKVTLIVTDTGIGLSSDNIKNLFEIFDGDKEFIISLLEVFIQETPEDLNSLRNCVTREYYPRASTLAHKMKSSFMNLGLTKPGQYLQQIEANINTPDKVEEAKKNLKSFENLYNKVLLDVNLQLINLKNN